MVRINDTAVEPMNCMVEAWPAARPIWPAQLGPSGPICIHHHAPFFYLTPPESFCRQFGYAWEIYLTMTSNLFDNDILKGLSQKTYKSRGLSKWGITLQVRGKFRLYTWRKVQWQYDDWV